MVTIRLPKRGAGRHSRADLHGPSRDSNFRGKLTKWSQRRPTAMKTLRIELWTSLLIFAFFPALAQAQSSVFRVYGGLAPTSYHITLDIPGAFNATAKSTYAAANLGATWVSPRGIYVDVSGQTSLNAKHDLWEISGDGRQKVLRDSYTLTRSYNLALSGGRHI